MGALSTHVPVEAAPDSAGDEINGATGRRRAIAFALLVGILAFSRYILAPRYLVTFDEINFALAVRAFNPGLHQPQPPGYPLFVGLLKLLSICLPTIEMVFLAAGLIVSTAALGFVWKAAEAMGGPRCGIVAASLLLFNPAFWLSALTNPVRLCFAAGATAVALCAWHACVRRSERWFLLAAASLGLAAGFRPELPILLAPVILWAAFHIRVRWRVAAAGVLCFVGMVATWLPSLVLATGGWTQFANILGRYSQAEMGGTSILFGAPAIDASSMAWKAVVWSCLGALSWLWAIPVLVRQKRASIFDPFTARFLLLWFLPGLLFYATFHVGDPDHTLSIVPGTCIAGAIALTALTRYLSARGNVTVIVIAVLLNVFLFVKPISKTAKASTYTPVRWLDDYIVSVIEGTNSLRGHAPLTVVFYESVTGWRQLSYYSPDLAILTVATGSDGKTRTRQLRGTRMSEISTDGIVELPSCGTVAWIDPAVRPTRTNGLPLDSTRLRVYYTHPASGESFDFHGFRFIAGRQTCTDRDTLTF
jgi:hypothetical protein